MSQIHAIHDGAGGELHSAATETCTGESLATSRRSLDVDHSAIGL